jgi:Phage integrase family
MKLANWWISGRRVTPHALRRTFATEMLNRGVRLETVSRLLGHAATTITEQAYAQLTDHRIRTEVEEALHTETAAAAVSKQSPFTLTIASHPPSNIKLTLAKGSRTTV